MKHLHTIAAICLLSVSLSTAQAQQDPTFTKYLFNGLIYNPGFAGSNDYMVINALHRQQWLGINGGPNTEVLSIHSPISKKVALGLNMFYDQLGPVSIYSAQAVYAYHLKIGDGNLGIGLSAGALNWRSDWTKLAAIDANDPAFANDPQPNFWRYNFGAGLHYKHKAFYAGFAVPHILEYDFKDKGITNSALGRQYRHYVFTAGTQFYLNPQLQFCPNFVLKTVGNSDKTNIAAQNTADIDLSFLFFEQLQTGAAYRFAIEDKSNSDSFDVWFSYKFKTGLHLGAAYDFPLNSIGQFGKGAYQLMVGYDFYREIDRVETPRTF
jgi:type IX secretion system PorP/SprF family membrane protein